MKTLSILMWAMIFAASASAQESPKAAAELEVVSKNWQRQVINTALYADPFRANDQYRDTVRSQKQQTLTLKGQTNEPEAKKSDNPKAAPPKASSTKPSASVSGRRFETYIYRAKVKNLSAKTIKAIAWEYVFTDPESKQELSRFRCFNKVKIAPGKSGDLIMNAPAPPSNFVDAGKAANQQEKFIEVIVISRIEYSDGSMWQPSQQ